jgi:predicted kinase
MTATMIFLMGLPAAGKSTVGRARYEGFTVIDPDAIKAAHPDYDPKNPAPLHNYSMEIAEQQFAAAVAGKAGNWIIDGTGTNAERMTRRIRDARAAGFTTELCYVVCSLNTAMVRNAQRARTVPAQILTEKSRDIATSFDIVSRETDTVVVINNDEQH